MSGIRPCLNTNRYTDGPGKKSWVEEDKVKEEKKREGENKLSLPVVHYPFVFVFVPFRCVLPSL